MEYNIDWFLASFEDLLKHFKVEKIDYAERSVFGKLTRIEIKCEKIFEGVVDFYDTGVLHIQFLNSVFEDILNVLIVDQGTDHLIEKAYAFEQLKSILKFSPRTGA